MDERIRTEMADDTGPVGRTDLVRRIGAQRKAGLAAIRGAIARGVLAAIERGPGDCANAQPVMLADRARALGYRPPRPDAPASAPWGRP